MLNSPGDENKGTYRSGERGGESPVSDPGSELLLGGRERESSARIRNGPQKQNKTKNMLFVGLLIAHGNDGRLTQMNDFEVKFRVRY